VAETTVKRLINCGFRSTDKAMEQVYQCWWRVCREIYVSFQVRISHVLRFIFICNLFTDSPSYHTAPHISGLATNTKCHFKRIEINKTKFI
jgi:hypothetical protein